MSLTRIGTVFSPYPTPDNMPIEPGNGGSGYVEVYPPYRTGLADLAGFERIWLLFEFHKSAAPQMLVRPFLDPQPRGVFATRAPARPSAIGMSVVRLLHVDFAQGRLECSGLDIVDGSPLIDIKPYVPRFDAHPQSRAGWLDARGHVTTTSDSRFMK